VPSADIYLPEQKGGDNSIALWFSENDTAFQLKMIVASAWR
jgi:hypothetical protein